MGKVVELPSRDTLATARLIVSRSAEHAWPELSAACQVLITHGSEADRAEAARALAEWDLRAEAASCGAPDRRTVILGWIVLILATVGIVSIATGAIRAFGFY